MSYQYTALEESWPYRVVKGINVYGSETYEVWKMEKTKKDTTLPNGAVIPAGAVRKPSSSAWGQKGWTFGSLEDAFESFRRRTKASSAANTKRA